MPGMPDVGQELGGYRIESLIQRGGMAVVFLARHLRMDRRVALKILAPELSGDERFRERFLREWKLAASLDHPNVIHIYDAGEEDGVLYIAMHYVEGTDLRELIARDGSLSPERALSIATQVGSALDVAHARGLVHRDVKPANILIVPPPGPGLPEHAYLADFGLTKHTASLSGLTQTGQFVGTVEYTAPEQIQGKPTDGRTDLYSLGCVLFECLTGRSPFRKENDVAVLWAHIQEDVPLITEHRPDLPAGLDLVIQKALAKEPDDRYQTCHEFLAAARAELTPERAGPPPQPTVVGATIAPPLRAPAPAPEPSGPRPTATSALRGKRLIVLGVVAAVLLVGVAAVALLSGDETRVGASASPTPTDATEPTPGGGQAGLTAAILGIGIEGNRYEVSYETTGFAETANGPHVHFFFDTVPPSEAGEPGDGPWFIYGGPSPFTQAKIADRPDDATALCILVAEPDHSVRPGTGNCVPLPGPPSLPYAMIDSITIEGGRYVVTYQTFGYQERLPGRHVHFFFDTVPVAQAGRPGSGPWFVYGGPRPFTEATVADRPANARKKCILVANRDHSIRPDTGNCVELPE